MLYETVYAKKTGNFKVQMVSLQFVQQGLYFEHSVQRFWDRFFQEFILLVSAGAIEKILVDRYK